MPGEALSFVDTNILVYALTDGKDQRHAAARQVFAELVEEERLCLSTQVLQEFFVTVTKKMNVPVREALDVVESLAAYPLYRVDETAIVEAGLLAAKAQVSFWDALIAVAARRLGAGMLLTEDLNHGQQLNGVLVHNPFVAS
jgi:predicted nucleic acid-binding protein